MIHSYIASYFPEAHIAVYSSLNCKSDFIVNNETLVGLQFENYATSPKFICQKPVYYVYILSILDNFAKLLPPYKISSFTVKDVIIIK